MVCKELSLYNKQRNGLKYKVIDLQIIWLGCTRKSRHSERDVTLGSAKHYAILWTYSLDQCELWVPSLPFPVV